MYARSLMPENIAGTIKYAVVTAVANIETNVVSLNVRYSIGTIK